jgi:hypothetical protein
MQPTGAATNVCSLSCVSHQRLLGLLIPSSLFLRYEG